MIILKVITSDSENCRKITKTLIPETGLLGEVIDESVSVQSVTELKTFLLAKEQEKASCSFVILNQNGPTVIIEVPATEQERPNPCKLDRKVLAAYENGWQHGQGVLLINNAIENEIQLFL